MGAARREKLETVVFAVLLAAAGFCFLMALLKTLGVV
jgi:hypothetical protein